jgi:hypothetical protein
MLSLVRLADLTAGMDATDAMHLADGVWHDYGEPHELYSFTSFFRTGPPERRTAAREALALSPPEVAADWRQALSRFAERLVAEDWDSERPRWPLRRTYLAKPL